jgi:hypothetical protein
MNAWRAKAVPCAQVIWFLYLQSLPLGEIAWRCGISQSVVDRCLRRMPKELKRGRVDRHRLIQAGRRALVIPQAQELRNLGASPESIGEALGVSPFLVRKHTAPTSCSTLLFGSERERQAVLDAYAQTGASLRSVAAQLGVSYDTVHRIVRAAGASKPRFVGDSMEVAHAAR